MLMAGRTGVSHKERIFSATFFRGLKTGDPGVTVIVTDNDETGTILAVGGSELLTQAHWGDRVESLDNHFVTPGLWDSHVHLLDYGRSFSRLKFSPNDSLAEILTRIKEKAHQTDPDQWIVGSGWNLQSLGAAPQRHHLDQAAPGRPVCLMSLDYHTVWLNAAAARRLGLNLQSRAVEAGILHEGEAFRVQEQIARIGADDPEQSVHEAIQSFARLGFVGVTAMERAEGLRALQRRNPEDAHTVRVNLFLRDTVSELERLGMEQNFGSAYLRILGIKLFSDGALGSHTAWMRDPYEVASSDRGTAVLEPDELKHWVARLADARLIPAIHAIGDQAVLETARALAGRPLPGPVKARIEHAQLLPDAALHILANAPWIAVSMQPVHLLVDRFIADEHWGLRARHAFRLRDIVDRGITAAFGSDAPIADPNPVLGLWSAVHRADPGDEPWHPAQRLSPAEAMWCYTRGAALADGRQSGVIAPGYWGDFTLWREDPLRALDEEAFDRLRVAGTVVAGRRAT
jgi:hypothetical protein